MITRTLARRALARARWLPPLAQSQACICRSAPLPTTVHSRHERRHFATPPPQLSTSALTEHQYHELSDMTMDTLLERLEAILDDQGNSDYDLEYNSGVLTLKLGAHGTYVINKQPPNKQIWLSSPISGPKRYDWVPDRRAWLYARDARTLGELLEEELGATFGHKIDLGLGALAEES